jgi:YD repeat-containing protein
MLLTLNDNAGNWDWFKAGSDPNTPYVPNALNLYDSINDPSAPETPTESFTYDDDHNLTEVCGTGVSPVRHAYDAENRLIEVVPAEDDPNNLTADD